MGSPTSVQPATGATWALRVVTVAGVLVVVWATVTGWGAVRHGHPLYAVLLAITAVLCLVGALRLRTGARRRTGWRGVLRWVGVVALVVWVVVIGWLRPFAAVEPALTAMESDAGVSITESPTEIVMRPTGQMREVGLFFQPGARVDARAYAAVLEPVAEAGHPVVIPKQPLGIGFLALGSFDDVPAEHPEVAAWVLGGHSLGGTVASLQAQEADPGVVAGLLFHASYPVGDLSDLEQPVLSVSGGEDGLATPDDIEDAASNLPPQTISVQVDGAVHAFFGDYGEQPGDGTPQISQDEARAVITQETRLFLEAVAGLSSGSQR